MSKLLDKLQGAERDRMEREDSAAAEAAATQAASARVRADAKALAVLQKRLAAAQKSEAQANRRAEAESAAADVVRAGIAMEEVLDKLPAHARARPARRWPWIAAGAALIGLTVAYGFLPVPTLDSAPGEPLKLKLEFAFPAARR